jgi:hypothetical protein
MREVRQIGYYVGPIPQLQGQRALLRCNVKGVNGLLAQFDDRTLELDGVMLGFGWHHFRLLDFRFPLEENPAG